VIFPGTFTSIDSLSSDERVQDSAAARALVNSVKHASLLWVAGFCCAIGAGGMIWLWWTWRHNFVWLLNKIFMPGCLNSIAGLMNTLVNVYSQQGGTWSVTAKVTAIVTGTTTLITGALFAIYNWGALGTVKRKHEVESRAFYGNGERERGGGFVEKMKRKADGPALEPGSVV